MIKHYSKEEDFNEIIKNKVLVDFYADWCGPCKMLAMEIEKAASEIDIDIVKVNVDEEEDIARRYGVMSIPTLILFENGQELKKTIGFMPKDKIKEFIED
mgnify:FL=1